MRRGRQAGIGLHAAQQGQHIGLNTLHVTAWMVVCAVVIVIGTALSTGLLKLGRKVPAQG